MRQPRQSNLWGTEFGRPMFSRRVVAGHATSFARCCASGSKAPPGSLAVATRLAKLPRLRSSSGWREPQVGSSPRGSTICCSIVGNAGVWRNHANIQKDQSSVWAV